jgi:2-dehydropantoate 2-reductase
LKIVIIGAGSIGSLFGGVLAKAGHDVWMVDKNKEIIKKIKEAGITIIDNEEICNTVKVNATLIPQEIKSCELILICVKCFATKEALANILHLVVEDVPVLSFQTGLDNLENIRSMIPEHNILGGVTYNGAVLLGPGKVKHTTSGITIIGELSGKKTSRVLNIMQAFENAGIDTEISDRIISHIWSKAIIYSAINPLTAMFQLRNGELLNYEEAKEIIMSILTEGVGVAKAYGISLVYDNPYEQLQMICKKTARHISPMLQAIINKEKTEIDVLNWAIVARGKKIGVQTPVNNVMVSIIRLLEKVAQDK